jgi:DNA-binding NarL/FixJ family response regulator
VDVPDDVWAWLTDAGTHVVVLGLCGAADWQLLTELHAARPDLLLLAVIDAPDTRAYVRAVKSGALGAIPRTSSSTDLQQSFTAMVKGKIILPAEVVRSLVASGPPGDEEDPGTPSAQELMWLRQLAGGSTVAELAKTAGYSERMMFRRLRALYSKFSARNRTEALMYARDNRWV